VKVLVLGSAGFIGSAVCREILRAGGAVIGIDVHSSGLYPESVKIRRTKKLIAEFPEHFQFHHADLTQLDLRPFIRDADYIVNEAAIPGLSLSWVDFDLYNSANLALVSRILEAMRSEEKGHLVHASTSSVYGSEAAGGEDSPTRPISPYGVTKLAAENLISAYQKEFGLSAIVLRYFSVFGPGQRPDMAYAKFINKLRAGKDITIFGDGNQTRSNSYIDDVAKATLLACNSTISGETMNICGDESITVLEAVHILAEELGVKARLSFMDKLPGDQMITKGDNSLAKRLLDWTPEVGLEEGLRLQARAELI